MNSSLLGEQLLSQLQQCSDLPTPPTVATKIIELSGIKTADLDTLANIVSMDPALSAKILGIANSSIYMRRIEADSIERAVDMFGWNGTLNIALGFAVVGSIRWALTSGMDYNYFWLRSLAAATSARALGQMTKCKDVESLFLPGLLQDIGMLALDKADKDFYANIGDSQQDHNHIMGIERQRVNVDHALVGEWLLSNWGIPEDVTDLVGLSHCDSYVHDNECLLEKQRCIFLSVYMADCLLMNAQTRMLEATGRLMESMLNICESNFFALMGHVASQFQEMAQIFELEVQNTKQL